MAKLVHLSDRVIKQLDSLKEELEVFVHNKTDEDEISGLAKAFLDSLDSEDDNEGSDKKKNQIVSYSFLIEIIMKRNGTWDMQLENKDDMGLPDPKKSQFEFRKKDLGEVIKQRRKRLKEPYRRKSPFKDDE